uniref:Nuclear pore complex protein Nup214 n=2 Tax=Petromyzon marinus TaxID=7757 RepID=A0AAJ7XDH1_PETMA|nr:nuclear pore complex protein Nup214 isoform X1 [Petromyzon marinus]XP_032829223.1 nuclear pore complex protein Nup214 isoform X1 [Petromyzon marinus]
MVDESYAPDRDMKEFQFRQMKRVRAFVPPGLLPCDRVSLLAVSSRYGLLFVGVPSGLRVYETRSLVAANTLGGDMDTVVEDVEHVELLLPQQPHQMSLSSDELTLALCLRHAPGTAVHFYDVRALAKKIDGAVQGRAAPFSVLHLPGAADTCALDMKWNPAAPSVAAVCLSDGGAHVLDVSGPPCISASLPPSASVTAICWSPKGKQLVCGKINGTMAQYTQSLQEKRQIPCAPFYAEDPVRVLDVWWVSTHVFAVVYAAADGSLDCSPQLVLITLPKKDEKTQEKFVNFSDLCFAPKSERQHRYYLHHVDEWDLIVAASSVSTDVGLLAKQKEDPTQWETWTLEDSSRAVCPVNENDDDTLPMGMAIDRSTHMLIPIGEDKSIPAAPMLVLLSTDGLLCPFYMLNKQPGAKAIVAPPQALPTHGERTAPPGGGPVAPPAAPSSTAQGPPPLTAAVAPTLKPAAAPTASTRAWPAASAAAPGAGPSSPPGVRFSFSPSPSLPAPLATSKAVTSMPAEPLRQVPALAQTQAASAMGNFTLGQMLAQPSAAMNSEGPSLFSTLAASPLSGGFSMRFPGTQSQSPATRPISRPPATSIATAGQQLPRAAPPSTTASQPPTNTGRPVTPARHAGPAAAVTAMKPTPQRSSDPYSVGISEEVSHFQRELDALKLRWAEDDFSVGTNEELSRMSHETQGLQVYLEQIKAKTVVQHAGVSRLQTEVLQGFAELEEARSCLERRRDPAYQQLLRQRSLHPASQKQLEEIRRLHRYVTFAIQDINNILDFQWDSYMQGQKQQKKLMVPEREGLYRCLANNRALLMDYLSTVNSLCQQLQTVRARKPLSTWGGGGTLPSPARQALPSWEADLRTLRDALSSTHIQSPSVAPSASFSVARVAQLRNFLSKRTTIVVRSTAPANLSGSAFLSTRRTQDLDAASSVSSVVCRPCLDELDVEQFDDDDDDDDDDGEEYDDNDEDNEDSEYDEQISRVRPSFQAPPPSAAHQPPPLTQHAPLQRTASVAPARVPGLSGAGAKGGGVATAPSATLKYGAPGIVGSEGSHEMPTFVNSNKPASSAAPPSGQGLGVGILLPRQAAAAAAISRNAASKPAVTSAPLTESTLKNVPKVVNVMDLSTFGAKPATNMVTSTAPANKNVAPKPSGGGGSSAAAFSFASHSAFSGGSPFSFSTASDGAAPTGGKTATTAASTEAAAPPQPSSQAPGRAPGGDASFGQFFDILKTANWNPGEPGKTHTGAPFSLASASNGRSLFGQPAPTTTATTAANAASAGKAAAFSFSLPVTTAAAATPTTTSAAVAVTQGPSLSSASAAVAPLPPPNTLSVGDVSPQTVPVASTAPVPSAVPVPPSAGDAAPAPSFVTTTVTATTVTAAAAEEPPSAALVPSAVPGAETPSPPPPAHTPQQETQDSAGAAVVGSEQPTAAMTAQVFSFCMPPASASTPAPGTVAQPTATSAVAPEAPSAAAAPAAAGAATATTAAAAAVPANAAFGVPSAFGQPPTTGVGTFATSTPLATPQPQQQQPQQAAGAPAAASPTPTFGFGQPSGEAFGVAPAFGAAAPTSAPAAATTTAPAAAPPATSTGPFAGTTPPVFGATSGSGVGLFGGGTGSTAGGFFGQPSAGGGGAVSAFGQAAPAAAAAAAPVSGATTGTVATTGFGFGSTSGFGSQSSSAPAFGQPAAGGGGAFGQPAAGSAGSLFGGTGGSGFFSGLGSKPSQEAANKNPFGQTNAGGLFAGSSNPPSLFGASAPAFCSPTSGTGGFGEQKPAGAGGTFSGGASVAAQGFGAISSPCKTPGFGGPPAFGSPPSFGGSPAFGAAPAFGAVPAFGSPVQAGAAPSAPAKVFGEGTVAASSGSFGFGVVGSAPSFGNLANQANLPSFGSVSAVSGGTTTFGSAPSGFGAPAQGFGAPAQGFGAQPTTFGGFGGGGGGTGFGSTGFGSQSTPSGSAFSGWRS